MEAHGITELFNYGVLGIILATSAWALWRIVVYLAAKLFDDDKGLLVQYVRDNRNFLQAMELREQKRDARDDRQQLLCDRHAELIDGGNDIAERTAASLDKLVSLHDDPASIFSAAQANSDLEKLKHVAIEGCKMCRSVAEQWPRVAEMVNMHCDAIEEIVGGDG